MNRLRFGYVMGIRLTGNLDYYTNQMLTWFTALQNGQAIHLKTLKLI